MSAFIVSNDHIGGIVHWAIRNCPSILSGNGKATIQEFGQWLVDANVLSVNTRYSDSEESFKYAHELVEVKNQELSAFEVIRLTQCLMYQSCEPENYRQTTVHLACIEIISNAAMCLPGIDAVKWAI